MGAYDDRAKLLWSLAGQGISGTISANGSSGTWGDIAPASFPSSAIPLSPGSDFQLMVYVNGKTSTPTFAVQFGYYDSQGHLFAPNPALTLSVTLTSVPTTAALNMGVRAGSGGSTYFAFPDWGNIAWTISGGTVTGVQIELWGK